jgi:hypothetical protein
MRPADRSRRLGTGYGDDIRPINLGYLIIYPRNRGSAAGVGVDLDFDVEVGPVAVCPRGCNLGWYPEDEEFYCIGCEHIYVSFPSLSSYPPLLIV